MNVLIAQRVLQVPKQSIQDEAPFPAEKDSMLEAIARPYKRGLPGSSYEAGNSKVRLHNTQVLSWLCMHVSSNVHIFSVSD
jgi:hypothetical protein